MFPLLLIDDLHWLGKDMNFVLKTCLFVLKATLICIVLIVYSLAIAQTAFNCVGGSHSLSLSVFLSLSPDCVHGKTYQSILKQPLLDHYGHNHSFIHKAGLIINPSMGGWSMGGWRVGGDSNHPLCVCVFLCVLPLDL